jgi:hypothetical protein
MQNQWGAARKARAQRRLSTVFLRRFLDFSNGHQPSNGIIDIKSVGLFARKALANLAGSAFRAGYNFGKVFESANFPFNGRPALSPYDTVKGLHAASPPMEITHPNRAGQPARSPNIARQSQVQALLHILH